jgi:2-polyprenyl-3-methyl-5-hydroxy-6-metoxy-1,4-benzoquinol methylase
LILENLKTIYKRLGKTAVSNGIASQRSQDDVPTQTPLHGWPASQVASPLLDSLTDEQLEELNRLLAFRCFTTDKAGRRFGNPAGAKKRNAPQELPDRRVEQLHREIDLSDKRVVEVGCFEGVHTSALCARAKKVTALDSRVENVVKTMVRCSFYDQHPRVAVFDLETLKDSPPEWLHCDVLFHVGVLYHLTDPVTHLETLLKGVSHSILLDTHVARDEQLDSEYQALGRTWKYFRYGERKRYGAMFAGMRDHAKWLHEKDLHQVLKLCGFETIKTLEVRDERNGLRVCILASRLSH